MSILPGENLASTPEGYALPTPLTSNPPTSGLKTGLTSCWRQEREGRCRKYVKTSEMGGIPLWCSYPQQSEA